MPLPCFAGVAVVPPIGRRPGRSDAWDEIARSCHRGAHLGSLFSMAQVSRSPRLHGNPASPDMPRQSSSGVALVAWSDPRRWSDGAAGISLRLAGNTVPAPGSVVELLAPRSAHILRS